MFNKSHENTANNKPSIALTTGMCSLFLGGLHSITRGNLFKDIDGFRQSYVVEYIMQTERRVNPQQIHTFNSAINYCAAGKTRCLEGDKNKQNSEVGTNIPLAGVVTNPGRGIGDVSVNSVTSQRAHFQSSPPKSTLSKKAEQVKEEEDGLFPFVGSSPPG